MSTESTQTGVVKWFDDGKGYGFITPEGGGKGSVCPPQRDPQRTGASAACRRTSAFEFEVKQGQKGLQAANIRVI